MNDARSAYKAILTSRYRIFGADAALISPRTQGPITLRVIDLSKPMLAGDEFAQVPTITPTISARADDLAALGIDAADLVGGEISYNGNTWLVASYQRRPGVFDDALDQIFFTLEEPTL